MEFIAVFGWFLEVSSWFRMASVSFELVADGFRWFLTLFSGFEWFRVVPYFSSYETEALLVLKDF